VRARPPFFGPLVGAPALSSPPPASLPSRRLEKSPVGNSLPAGLRASCPGRLELLGTTGAAWGSRKLICVWGLKSWISFPSAATRMHPAACFLSNFRPLRTAESGPPGPSTDRREDAAVVGPGGSVGTVFLLAGIAGWCGGRRKFEFSFKTRVGRAAKAAIRPRGQNCPTLFTADFFVLFPFIAPFR